MPPRPKSITKNKPVQSTKQLSCLMCGELKIDKEFYQSYDSLDKIGKIQYCKPCIKKMATDSYGKINIESFKKMLEKINRPYISDLLEVALKDNNDTIGVYFKNLSLPQYRELKYKDSSFDKQQVINNDEVSEQQLIYSNDWMGRYTTQDIAYLDDYLKGLRKDFKITTRNHIDYARKIAKASLAMDKAYEEMINNGGSDARYKSLRETFDTLSKSAQFAEAGRGINDVSLGSFGVVFDRVEKHQWIPKHQPSDKDTYDNLLDQFSNINKSV